MTKVLSSPQSPIGRRFTFDDQGSNSETDVIVLDVSDAVIPGPTTSHIIFVSSVYGNDTTNDGTMALPFATIAHAQLQVVAPSLAEPWDICLMPGTYEEDVVLLAFSRLIGWDASKLTLISDARQGATFLNGGITVGSSFAADQSIANVTGVQVAGDITLDFAGASGPTGLVSFTSCYLHGNVTTIGDSTNETQFHETTFGAGDVSQLGGKMRWLNCNGIAHLAHLSILARAGGPTLFQASGGSWAGDLHVTQNGVTDQDVTCIVDNFTVPSVSKTVAGAAVPSVDGLLAPIAPNADYLLIPDNQSPEVMTANVAGLAALLARPAGAGGVAWLPRGSFHFNGHVPFQQWDRITLRGQGLDATKLYVHDLDHEIFLDCYKPGGEIQHCTLEAFSIFGVGTLNQATAVREMNWTRGRTDIRIFDWTGSKSIGMLLAGREFNTYRLGINADKCIVLTKNLEFPDAALCLDHTVFEQLALWSLDPVEPCIQNDGALDVSTTTFEGTTAFVSDGGGIRLSGMHDINNLLIQEVRHESALIAPTMTNWGIELDGNHNVRALTILNCSGKANFIKVRNAQSLNVIDCKYEGDPASPGVTLDVDETCISVSWINLISTNGVLNIGALTYTTSTQFLTFGDGVAIPSFATLTNATIPLSQAGRRSNAVYSWATRTELLKTQTLVLGPANHPSRSGTMVISGIATEIDATVVFAIELVTKFGLLAPIAGLESANVAHADTPGFLSLYTDVDGNIKIKNNTARDLDLTVTWN